MPAEPKHPAPMLLVHAMRWLAFGWMLVVAMLSGQIQRPVEAGIALLCAGCWTAWLTAAAVRRLGRVLAVDLTLAIGLTVVYGHVYPPHALLTNHPSFVGAYPAAAVVASAVGYGVRGGLAAGAVLGLSLPIAYAANEISLTDLSFLQWLTMIGWGLSYVLIGGAVGVAARQLVALHGQAARDRERAARMTERERLATRIHDDVLQSLGRLRARIGELSTAPALLAVAEGIARQEVVLRGLAQLEPDSVTLGNRSLRDRLAELAGQVEEVPVRLVASGPVPLPDHVVAEVGAAVSELLTNVVKHAKAHRVWLTLLAGEDTITVDVRDDGVGFVPEMDSGGLGMRLSVNARISRLGGDVRVHSRPGHGTEVELRLPASLAADTGRPHPEEH